MTHTLALVEPVGFPVAADSFGRMRGAPARSLEALMAAYVDGHAEAFTELHRRLAPKLNAYIVRLCRDPALAEDVVQATFA
jgi:hypothetical protein